MQKETKNNGLFVTFEGLDGAGKSTQVKELLGTLTKNGYNVLGTSEPRGTAIGKELCNLLFFDKINKFDAITEALIFNAVRREHIAKTIAPALNNGAIVVCDRFIDSTLAIQGNSNDINLLNYIACGSYLPNITFFIDLPAEISNQRIDKRHKERDRFENEGIERFEIIRNNYHNIMKQDPGRFCIIDGTESKQKQADKIYKITEELFLSRQQKSRN